MAINKFDRFVNKDWSWTTPITKMPELDVAGFNDVLAQQQTQIDQVGLLSDKKPNVLNNQPDLELYQGYKADVDKAINHVSEEYGKGITAGQMAYKNYLNQFRKDWSPGGRADILNKRTEAYNTALKNIDEFYKDDASPVNKTLAKKQLQDQLANPLAIDNATGKFTNFSQPELYKNPDVNKAIDEMLKEIKANGDTKFLGDQNKSWWLQKIQTETREPERIKLAYQALASQPEYAAQINRDAQYKGLGIDPVKYQEQFTLQQNNALKEVNSLAEKAKSDPKATEGLQQLLRSEGYNVKVDGAYGPLTKKAAKDFLSKKKEDVNSNISGFNLDAQLRGEVDKSYLGYALRGAYHKTDMDPVFNQAKKAQMDYSLKKEENSVNMWRAQMEYAPKDQSSVTAVSGIAQKLPEIQTYHKDLKTQLSETEKNVDKALSNSKTFQGWTKENVAEAYNTWNKVTGNTPEERKANYKALLAQKSSYPFSDQQVDELFKEMNGAGDGVIKTTLKTLGQLQSEVNRVEEGQAQIASQYLNTPEGQKNIYRFRALKTAGETDQQLANRLMNGNIIIPGDESSTEYNASEDFQKSMLAETKAQQKNGMKYNWGSLGTYEIYANNDDKTIKPTLDGFAQAIETGTGMNFSTFNKAGMSFKNLDGEDVNSGKSKKVNNMSVTKAMDGTPILRVGVTITPDQGKAYNAYTDINLVPGSVESIQMLNGLKKSYVSKLNSGDVVSAQAILDNIEALEGNDGKETAAMDIQIKDMNTNNTAPETIYTLDPAGQLVDVTTLGWQAKNLEKDENIDGYGYQLYGFNTYTGNVAANVMLDENGNKIIVPDPTQPGTTTFKSSNAALKARKAKSILKNTPVEITETKVHGAGQSERSSKTEITKTQE